MRGAHRSELQALRRRRIAAPALGLLLLSQVGTLAHLFVVVHGVCVEHGEAVELGKSDTAQVAAAPAARTSVAGTRAADGHHHDCPVIASLSNHRGALASAAGDVPDAGEAGIHGATANQPAVRPYALLHDAPKLPPPPITS